VKLTLINLTILIALEL